MAIVVALLFCVYYVDKWCQQPVFQHVAAVSQDVAFQWAGHRLEHRKYRILPQDACIMDRSRPTNNTVHDAGIGVTNQLHVYCMVVFLVDVFVFINCRGSDLDVRAVDATDDIWKVRHSMEHNCHGSCHGIRLALWVETNVSRHKASEGCSHSVNSSRYGCLANTK